MKFGKRCICTLLIIMLAVCSVLSFKPSRAYASDNEISNETLAQTLIDKIPLTVRSQYEHLIIAVNQSPNASGIIGAMLWNGEANAIVRWGDSTLCPASTGLFPSNVTASIYSYIDGVWNYVKESHGMCATTNSTFYMPTIIYSSVNVYMQLEIGVEHYIDETQLLYNADTYAFKVGYNTQNPYVKFNKVEVINKMADGDTRVLFSNPYDDYTKKSVWKYMGKLLNRNLEKDKNYRIEASFTVELPTDSYIEFLANKDDFDISWEYNQIRKSPDMVSAWNADKRADKRVYTFKYNFDIVPDEHGYFSYELPFVTIENLVKYFNTDALESFKEYDKGYVAFLMSFVHVDCVVMSVKTVRDSGSVYGRVTTNDFERGVYDICLEIVPDIDINSASPEEIDKVIQEDLEKAQDEYLKKMQERLEELEKQLNDSTNLTEGENLWNAFKNTVSGVLSMLSTLLVIPQAFGQIFTFFPEDVQDYMGYVLIVVFVVIVWKSFKK